MYMQTLKVFQVPKSGLKGAKTEITDDHKACGSEHQVLYDMMGNQMNS